MNPISSHTSVPTTTQELLVRTLASDVASLQHGNQNPMPERLTATFQPEQSTESPTPHTNPTIIHVVLALMFLIAVGAAIYFFVYPALTAQKAAVL